MKKTLPISIVTFFIGCITMYMVIKFYPIYVTDTKGEIRNDATVQNVVVKEIGLSTGINNVYDSVVVVQNYKNDKQVGIGSGFIYNSEGYIMTNSHVIEGATSIRVILMSEILLMLV